MTPVSMPITDALVKCILLMNSISSDLNTNHKSLNTNQKSRLNCDISAKKHLHMTQKQKAQQYWVTSNNITSQILELEEARFKLYCKNTYILFG